jgi:hypothetical protein
VGLTVGKGAGKMIVIVLEQMKSALEQISEKEQ